MTGLKTCPTCGHVSGAIIYPDRIEILYAGTYQLGDGQIVEVAEGETRRVEIKNGKYVIT